MVQLVCLPVGIREITRRPHLTPRLTMNSTLEQETKELLEIGTKMSREEKSNTPNSPMLDRFIVLIRLLLVLVSTTLLLTQTIMGISPTAPQDFMALAVSSLGLYEGVTNG